MFPRKELLENLHYVGQFSEGFVQHDIVLQEKFEECLVRVPPGDPQGRDNITPASPPGCPRILPVSKLQLEMTLVPKKRLLNYSPSKLIDVTWLLWRSRWLSPFRL